MMKDKERFLGILFFMKEWLENGHVKGIATGVGL